MTKDNYENYKNSLLMALTSKPISGGISDSDPSLEFEGTVPEKGKLSPTYTQIPLNKRFQNLTATWQEEVRGSSLSDDSIKSEAYAEIMALGEKVIPMILKDFEIRSYDWFWALQAITGVDPVKPQHRGNIEQMKADWISWGKEHGYIP